MYINATNRGRFFFNAGHSCVMTNKGISDKEWIYEIFTNKIIEQLLPILI